MKKGLILVLLCAGIWGRTDAQLNNEWIDYSKTYYKFKLASNGLYRIPFTTLQQAGLSNVPMEQFQLFRNGQEVPLVTSKASGLPGATDFIEFYGKMNDGRQDAAFYRQASFQLNDVNSILTDSAAYFLTVQPNATAKRMVNEENEIAGNTLPPEPSFMYTHVRNFREKLNFGLAAVSGGVYSFSSSFDPAEGWTSRDVRPSSPISERINLFPFSAGANAVLAVSFAGNAPNSRTVEVSINGTVLIREPGTNFSHVTRQASVPINLLGAAGGDAIVIRDNSSNSSDRLVVGKYAITYPRLFNFGGSRIFEFSLPPAPAGNYLEIQNFNHGNTEPVLLDLSNNTRYRGSLSGSTVRFRLKPSQIPRNLVLLNAQPENITTITGLQSRTFRDYRSTLNQGDYMIISNRRLFAGPSGNPIENYRTYRSSALGGGYNARIYDVEEILDQFGYGLSNNAQGVKNFIHFARTNFATKPKYILIIGRGLQYNDACWWERFPVTHELNLVPTYGNPGSDNLLASAGYEVSLDIPVGRISAITGAEVETYLQKVKQVEATRLTMTNTIKDRAWMKNVVHAIGGGDPYLQSVIASYMKGNSNIIADTSIGAKVYTFSQSSGIGAETISADGLSRLFEEGIGMLTYFGHSSTDLLEFNIDYPEAYNNDGKYPLFIVNGCLAGNIFVFDTLRARGGGITLSERYNLAKNRGSIGFIANSHFGVVNYLNIFTGAFYGSYARENYGKSIGQIHASSLTRMKQVFSANDLYGRMHIEQTVFHGDPAVQMYAFSLPDFVVEENLIKISPNPVSITEKSFKLFVRFANIGKSVRDSLRLRIQRRLPDGRSDFLFDKKIPAPLNFDSLELDVPINPLTDKGQHQITVMLDADQTISEENEMNNRSVKEFVILENDIRPVYPLENSVINKTITQFHASVSNPFAQAKLFYFEMDTTARFDSPFKKKDSVNSRGGILSFNVNGISWLDSTVYYWRTSPAPEPGKEQIWNVSSFLYHTKKEPGFGQAHNDQFKKNTSDQIVVSDNRSFVFNKSIRKFSVKTGLYPVNINNRLLTTLDELLVVNYGCRYSSIQVVVLDGITMQPWRNTLQADRLGRFGSWPPCDHNVYAFEFPYADPAYRRRAVQFLESIPDGSIVSITNFGADFNNSFINSWMTDTLTLGSNRSLYHSLVRLGFTEIDKFRSNVPFAFIAKKGKEVLVQEIGTRLDDYIEKSLSLEASGTSGVLQSPWFGPSASWNRLEWFGVDTHPKSDINEVEVLGRNEQGRETLLFKLQGTDTSLAAVDASRYPYIQLRLRTRDTANATPFQLKRWIVSGELPPEGAVVTFPNDVDKDTVEVGQPYLFQVGFRNVSASNFDSVRLKLLMTNTTNVTSEIQLGKLKPLKQGDSILFRYTFDTRNLTGSNTLFLQFNPERAQPEQYVFNNFIYKSFFVNPDTYKPSLDVTFDGVRILNEDIVSPRPHIQIQLTDNSRFMLLDDTSLLKVRVRYPDNQIKTFHFNSNTLQFTPASLTGNMKENKALIDFYPNFTEDGTYELLVTGMDKSGNSSGVIEYQSSFSIVNKPMISNLLNYPNPFTRSTAFVFTLTGAQIPQQLRIQILTITGRVVREITREELGPIRIGRNITEYKWDGTDQYGQPLANGIYLYRVLTNLNGKSLDKLDSGAEGMSKEWESKYFNKGYGKMYLMR